MKHVIMLLNEAAIIDTAAETFVNFAKLDLIFERSSARKILDLAINEAYPRVHFTKFQD